ncbi:Maf family protein [Candidatus Xianfuyuplasma coldseepsis]|uniref:dTTP/UTP pyrophosphatase n=1 Tax=Candidatus Xianfuyuplasma coldseepsis TaxID=2782163 RepID=A0A7L7KQR2_9MOLU|nr:Maf family protein [Xianfuyuplasma coldseepsis]QMS85007.1 septum formation protein Maf [Xianfuyuplasma coldseepsis]
MLAKKFILASQSPRRRELLKFLDIEFVVKPSDVEEVIDVRLSFEEVVMDLAKQKAEYIADKYPDHTILGFDTLVIHNGMALGKPNNRQEAFDMLQSLSGETHTVLTGCALVCCNEVVTFYDQADVTFNQMTADEINEYLDTGEPFDKAGSYGIQGYGARYINKVNGDYYSVMGVPLQKLYQTIRGLE